MLRVELKHLPEDLEQEANFFSKQRRKNSRSKVTVIMSAQWKAFSKLDRKKFVNIFSQQRNLKRLRSLGQTLGYSLKGLCIGVTGGSLVGYPAAVSGKSMQPVFNYPTRSEPTLWQFSCVPVPDEPFSDNMWEEEEREE